MEYDTMKTTRLELKKKENIMIIEIPLRFKTIKDGMALVLDKKLIKPLEEFIKQSKRLSGKGRYYPKQKDER